MCMKVPGVVVTFNRTHRYRLTYFQGRTYNFFFYSFSSSSFFFFMAVLGFKLMVSHFQGRCSVIGATPPTLFALVIIQMGSHIFALSGLRL
jgi:hypothetical protein